MNESSRREFIKTCITLALSGLSTSFLHKPSACNELHDLVSDLRGDQNEMGKINSRFEPPYVDLHRNGELKRRGEKLWDIMKSCELCPRECGANRLDGERGFCGSNAQLEISSNHPHFGEEKPLVGRGGSGTIFLTNCSLRCVFCINWEISQGGHGSTRRIEDMAAMMLALQDKGCPNINVVTPTHYSPHIVLAVDAAAAKGLRIPLVYNTCGWEKPDIIKMLDDIVDIYLPDFKYAHSRMSATYSSDADTYPELTKASLLEMNRQVGVAHPASDGLMYRGLMIRHLVMPNNVGGTREVIEWIANNLPLDTYVNIMSQYRPMYKAFDYPKIARRLKRKEYEDAVKWAKEAGLVNLDIQGM